MNHVLIDVEVSFLEAIYQIKKDSIYDYVVKLCGWNETHQKNDFYDHVILENFKLIVVNHEVAGFLEVCDEIDQLNLSEIHLKKAYQNLGIGSCVVNDLVSQSLIQNKTFSVGCFKINQGACKLYKRLGLRQVRETKTHYLFDNKL